MNDAAERLAATLGPVERIEDVEVDGLRRLVHGATFTVLGGSPSRVRAELEGASRGHPLAPRWLASSDEAWAIERTTGPAEDPVATVLAALELGRPKTRTGTLSELLALAEPRPDRALVALGVPRKHVDRALSQALSIAMPIGRSLGGPRPSWIHGSAGGAVCLSMRRASALGEPLEDLAALELGAEVALDAHAQGHVDALAIARLRIGLREAVLGPRPAREAAAAFAREAFEHFVRRDAERVRLRVEAPPCLDLDRYAPLGDDVPASHARFVLRALDRVVIAGEPVQVHVEPPVRPGRVARPFEDRRARLSRLFGHEDARFDDEGLFSATPVALAREVVSGLRGVVVDGTCGVGCLAIAAAELPAVRRVIAIDVDSARLDHARHLARLRGVASKVELRLGDVSALLPSLEADGLVLDPPWGGRDYDRGAVSLGDLGLDVRPLIARFEGALRLKLPRGTRDVPAGLEQRAVIDERGEVKFLLARR